MQAEGGCDLPRQESHPVIYVLFPHLKKICELLSRQYSLMPLSNLDKKNKDIHPALEKFSKSSQGKNK